MMNKSGDKDEMRSHINNAYIESKLNSIIEPMVKQLMSEQPNNHVSARLDKNFAVNKSLSIFDVAEITDPLTLDWFYD